MAPKTPTAPKSEKTKRVLTPEQLAKMKAGRLNPAQRLPKLQEQRAKIVAEYEGRLAKVDAKIARATCAPASEAVQAVLDSGMTPEQIKAERNKLNAALRALDKGTPADAESVGAADAE